LGTVGAYCGPPLHDDAENFFRVQLTRPARTPMKSNHPSHEDIARRAHEIWTASGNTHGLDIGHWLEAERELMVEAAPTPSIAHESHSLAPSPDAFAALAAQQKNAARAPQLQHGKNAPHAAPPESGKPLWDKPHSS
jgi:hypothetical protein